MKKNLLMKLVLAVTLLCIFLPIHNREYEVLKHDLGIERKSW